MAKNKTKHGLICPYCMSPVAESDLVLCGKCGIPHHRDCWRANGGCTTYGCEDASPLAHASPPPDPNRIEITLQDLQDIPEKPTDENVNEEFPWQGLLWAIFIIYVIYRWVFG